MKKLCHVMLSLLFMLFFTSCGNDEVENVLNVGEMMRLEGEFVSVMDNQSCEVCNNVGEFVSVVGKDTYKTGPKIDFNRSAVVVIKDTSSSGVSDIEAAFEMVEDRCEIKVFVTKNYTTMVEPWCVALVVPRVESDNTNLYIDYNF